MKLRLALPIAAVPVALFALAPLAAAQTPTLPAPPAIAQLCAATGIAEVDDLLDGVARSQLVGELSPLATLVVPTSDTVEFDAAVSLDDVRKKLNCAPTGTPTPTATPTATPTPSATATAPPTPTVIPTPAVPTVRGGGFTQVDQVPVGSVETGSA